MDCTQHPPADQTIAERLPACAEFFTRFTLPKTKAKWTSRMKCNGTHCSIHNL